MSEATSPQEAVPPPKTREGAYAQLRRWLLPILAVPTPVIFAVAAALAIFLLWRQGGTAEIVISVRHVHPARVAAILLAYAASIMLLAFRWHTLVRMIGGTAHWTRSSEVFLTSVIVNYAAPIGLAVPTRAALTVRDLKLSPGQSGTVVAWDVALDLVALTVISLGWLVLGGSARVPTVAVDGRILVLAAIVVALAVVALGVISRPAVRTRIALISRSMLAGPGQRPVLAVLAVALTGGFWCVQMAIMAALLQVFGVAVTTSLLFGIMGLPVLIGMLSPLPGGAGIREALMVAAARLGGAAGGPVLLAAVAYRLALFLVTPLVWAVVRFAGAASSRR